MPGATEQIRQPPSGVRIGNFTGPCSTFRAFPPRGMAPGAEEAPIKIPDAQFFPYGFSRRESRSATAGSDLSGCPGCWPHGARLPTPHTSRCLLSGHGAVAIPSQFGTRGLVRGLDASHSSGALAGRGGWYPPARRSARVGAWVRRGPPAGTGGSGGQVPSARGRTTARSGVAWHRAAGFSP